MNTPISILGTGLAVNPLVVATFFGMPAAQAEVRLPDCADLQVWIVTVDPAKRWNPVDGTRAWLPAAFQDPAFVETFGTAPLEWTKAEAGEASKRLFECGSEAGDAGDRVARKAFYGARGWFKNNLVGVLVARERAAAAAERQAEKAARREQINKREEAHLAAQRRRTREQQHTATAQRDALEAALADVVNQPDSLRLLQTLVVLRETNSRDALAVNSAIGQFGQKAGALLGQARHLKLTMRNDPIGPALDYRIAELRTAIVADYTKRFGALSAAEPGALGLLARWQGEVQEQLADALGPQATSNLLTQIAAQRAVIEGDILAGLTKRIDEASESPQASEGLARVQESIERGRLAGLAPERQERLREHAAEVEARLAESAVVEAQAALASVSQDLDGLHFLLNTIPRADRPPLSLAPQTVLASYQEAARERLDEVAAGTFSAFEDGLRDFPETREGLRLIERTVVSDKAFSLVSPDIREEYVQAVDVRREEIQTALRDAAEQARQESIDRVGDADLVGYVFENDETGLAVGFLDEKRAVVGLNGKEDMVPYEVHGSQVLV